MMDAVPKDYTVEREIYHTENERVLRVRDVIGRPALLHLVDLKNMDRFHADRYKRFCRLVDRGQSLIRIGHAGFMENVLFYDMPLPDSMPDAHGESVPATFAHAFAARKADSKTVLRIGIQLLEALERLKKDAIYHGSISAENVAYYGGNAALGDIGPAHEDDLPALGNLLLQIAEQPDSPLLKKTVERLCHKDIKQRITNPADARKLFRSRLKQGRRTKRYILGILLLFAAAAIFSVPFILTHDNLDYSMLLRGKSGRKSLNKLVRSHNIRELQKLLQEGADPNQSGKNGTCPLHAAVLNHDPYIVGLLLKYGANPNLKDGRGKTPMHYAAETGDSLSMELFLNAGVNLQLTDSMHKTPEDCAADAKKLDVFRETLREWQAHQ